MSKARKTSIDSSRRPLKAHIPYRADDFTHGKKTGVNVREVARRSDGFEEFGDVLGQADAFTPPHMRGKRRTNRTPTPEEEDDDENGEMSMDIDDTMTTTYGVDSPSVYFNNARRPSAPTSANRSAATGLNSSRSSYIDFDRIPSPRPSFASARQHSKLNGSAPVTPRAKSKLSYQTVVPSSPEDDGSDNEPFNDAGDDFGGGGDFGGDDDFMNDPLAPESPSPVAARTSFTEIAQDDTDPLPMDDIQVSSPPRRKVKKNAKQKQSVAEESMALEEEIAQGLVEVEEGGSDEENRVEEETLTRGKNKKKRTTNENAEPAPKEKKKPVKRMRAQMELQPIENEMQDGTRRGSRIRYKPLEWWRCEKVVYGRRESGTSMVPVIKDIIRIPKEAPQSLAHKNKPRSKRRSQSKTVQDEDQETLVFNPEEGWDDQTDPHGVVLDFHGGQEVQRRLAFTAKMLTPKPAANNDFLYQKVFGDGEFIASGQLELPVGGKKPSKGTKDNTYVFYLIEGAINLKVHRSSFVLSTGAMFLVPRGNTYYLENICQRPAKLFFAQARKVSADDEPPQEVVRVPPPGSSEARRTKSVDPTGPRLPSGKSGSLARSSSMAAGMTGDKSNPSQRKSTKRAVSK